MIGPLFKQEMLLGARRNRLHVFRWLLAGWLILQILFYYLSYSAEESRRARVQVMTGNTAAYRPGSAPQIVGGWFAESYVFQQFVLLTLMIPALVAGAITEEKQRGTLQYMLTTDLDARHIVLGKLLGRVAQVLWLLLVGLPLFALLAGFSGLPPRVMLFLILVFIPVVLGLASASLLASVWCRQTRDAVLSLYCVGGVSWLILYLIRGDLGPFNPINVAAPVWAQQGPDSWQDAWGYFVQSVLCWGGVTVLSLSLAIWRLRTAYIRQLINDSAAKQGIHWYHVERDPVSDDPIRWREQNVEGLAPLAFLKRFPGWLALTLVALAATLSSALIIDGTMIPGTGIGNLLQAAASFNVVRFAGLLPSSSDGFLLQGLVVLFLASLVVGIRSSGAIVGERERKTWDPMLLTPITAKQMIRSKMWGILGSSYWYLLAYAAPAVCLSVLGGFLAFFYTILWLAVTFLAMYYLGAAGLWCSSRANSSWRSLLGTLGFGYLGAAVIMLPTAVLGLIFTVLLAIALIVIDMMLGTQMGPIAARNFSFFGDAFTIGLSIGLAVAFFLVSRLFLNWAARWIADRERTRFWEEEPIYRRSRRRRDVDRGP